jgi:KOW motif
MLQRHVVLRPVSLAATDSHFIVCLSLLSRLIRERKWCVWAPHDVGMLPAQVAVSYNTVTQAAKIVSFLLWQNAVAIPIRAKSLCSFLGLMLWVVIASTAVPRMIACLPFLQGPLKDWEHYELTKNGKPVRLPMPMRTGDTVKVISGHDKGKVGKVTKVRVPPRRPSQPSTPLQPGAALLQHR